MKYGLVAVCFLTACMGQALPLSQEARAEADLFNAFLEATYAQHRGDENRVELLQKALAKAPDSSYIKQQLVAESIVSGNLSQAEPYLDFIESAQEDADAWTIYGAYHLSNGHPQQALEAYEKALALEPDDERILFEYISVLAANDPAKAAQEMESLAASRPVFAPQIYNEIGRMYLYYQNYPLALKAFDKAVALAPQNPQPREGRVAVYEKTNQHFLMLHELEELEKMGAATAKSLSQMGAIFVLVKDLPQAETYFLKAKALDNGDPVAGYFLAALAEQREDYAHAISYVKDTQDYAQSPAKQIQVSYYQRKLNQVEESFKTISKAYVQFPDNNEVAYLYAVALYEHKKYAKSARVLAPLVEQLPQNQEIRLQYAFALEGQKKYRELENQLSILLEQNPQNAAALNLWAYSLALRNEQLEKASQYATQALSLAPQDPSIIDTQAWIFYLQGKYPAAADLMRAIPGEVLRANPEMAYHAGMIEVAQGNRQEARNYLQQAANGGWKDAAKALKKLK